MGFSGAEGWPVQALEIRIGGWPFQAAASHKKGKAPILGSESPSSGSFNPFSRLLPFWGHAVPGLRVSPCSPESDHDSGRAWI